MQVSINEKNGESIEAVVCGITGLEVQVTVYGEVDPGQAFKAPSRADPIGDPSFDADFAVNRVAVYVGVVDGEDYEVNLDLSREQESEIAEAILEHLGEDQ